MTSQRHEDYFGTTTNPCPWWCEQPSGHGYDNLDNGQPARLHSREVGHVVNRDLAQVPVFIEAMETLAFEPDGLRVRSGPLLCSAPDAQTLDRETVLHLAVLLTQAAHLMRSISD